MKLILCPHCDDMVRLIPNTVRWCSCGECGGKYLEDELHAVITEGAVPLGFDNHDLASAAIAYLHGRITESVRYFAAFVLQCNSDRIQIVSKDELTETHRAYWVCNYCQFTNHDFMHSNGKCVNCGREPTEYMKSVMRTLSS